MSAVPAEMQAPIYTGRKAEGAYRSKVLKQGFTKSGLKGTRGFVTIHQLIEHLGMPDPNNPKEIIPFADGPHPVTGTVTVTKWLTPDTRANVMADLSRTFQFRGDINKLRSEHPEHQSFVDREVLLYCKHEPSMDGVQIFDRWNWSLFQKARFIREDELPEDLFAPAGTEAASQEPAKQARKRVKSNLK